MIFEEKEKKKNPFKFGCAHGGRHEVGAKVSPIATSSDVTVILSDVQLGGTNYIKICIGIYRGAVAQWYVIGGVRWSDWVRIRGFPLR